MTEKAKTDFTPIRAYQNGGPEVRIGFISLEDFEEQYAALGFTQSVYNVFKTYSHSHRNSVSVMESYTFGLLEIIEEDGMPGDGDRVGICIKKDLFLIVSIRDRDGSAAAQFSQMIESANGLSGVTLERLVYLYLSRSVLNSGSAFDSYEATLDRLDKHMLDQNESSFNECITDMRHRLLKLHNYYEHLVAMGQELLGNENDVFEGESLRYMNLFTERASRVSGNVKMLREEAAQIREANQAQLDHQLNNIMKIFTVVTAIFMPLTLITSWYGMNFSNMPELRSAWGYPAVFLACVTVAAVCLWVFHRKKLL